jgi:hypothetical protein
MSELRPLPFCWHAFIVYPSLLFYVFPFARHSGSLFETGIHSMVLIAAFVLSRLKTEASCHAVGGGLNALRHFRIWFSLRLIRMHPLFASFVIYSSAMVTISIFSMQLAMNDHEGRVRILAKLGKHLINSLRYNCHFKRIITPIILDYIIF